MMEAEDHVSDSDFILEWEIICSDDSSDEALIPTRPAVRRYHREGVEVDASETAQIALDPTSTFESRSDKSILPSISNPVSPTRLHEDINSPSKTITNVSLSPRKRVDNAIPPISNLPTDDSNERSPLANKHTTHLGVESGATMPRYYLRARRDEQLHPYKMEKLNAKNIGIYERTELQSQEDRDYTPPVSPSVGFENSGAQMVISQTDALLGSSNSKAHDSRSDESYNSSSDDERIFLSRTRKRSVRQADVNANSLREVVPTRGMRMPVDFEENRQRNVPYDTDVFNMVKANEAEEYDAVEPYRPIPLVSKKPTKERSSGFYSHASSRRSQATSSSLNEFHDFMRIFNRSGLPHYRTETVRKNFRRRSGLLKTRTNTTGRKIMGIKRSQQVATGAKSTMSAIYPSRPSNLLSHHRPRVTTVGSTVVEYRDGRFASHFLSELGNGIRPSFLDDLSRPLSTAKLADPGLVQRRQAPSTANYPTSMVAYPTLTNGFVTPVHSIHSFDHSPHGVLYDNLVSLSKHNDTADFSDIYHILRGIPSFDLPELFPGCAELDSPNSFLIALTNILRRSALVHLDPREGLLIIKILASSFSCKFSKSNERRRHLSGYILQALFEVIHDSTKQIGHSGNQSIKLSTIQSFSGMICDIFRILLEWWGDDSALSSLLVQIFGQTFSDLSETWGLVYAVTDVSNNLKMYINWDDLFIRELRESISNDSSINYHRLRNALIGCHQVLSSHQWSMRDFKFLTAMFTVFGDRRWKNFETSTTPNELVLLPKFISSEVEAYNIDLDSDSIFSIFMKIVILVLRRSITVTGGQLSQVVRAEGHRADNYANGNIQHSDLEALANDFTVNLVGAKYLKRYKWIRTLESRIKLQESHSHARNLSLSALFHSLMIVFDAKNNGDVRSNELGQIVDWLEKLVEATVKSSDDASATYISRAIHVFIQKRAGMLLECSTWTDILTPLVVLWERFGFNVKQNLKLSFLAALEVEKRRKKLAEELVFTDEGPDAELPQPTRMLASVLGRLKFEEFLEDSFSKKEYVEEILLDLRFVCEVQCFIVRERVSTWYAILCGYGYGSVIWNSPRLRVFEPLWLKQAYLSDPRAFSATSVADLLNEKFFIQLVSAEPSEYLMDLFSVMKNIYPLSKASWGMLRSTIQEQREELLAGTLPFMNRNLFNTLKEEVKRQKAWIYAYESGSRSTSYDISVTKHFENHNPLATRIDINGSLTATQGFITEALRKWQVSGDISMVKELAVSISDLEDEKRFTVMRLILIDFPTALCVYMENNNCDCTFFALPLILFAKRCLWDSVCDRAVLNSCIGIYMECAKVYCGFVAKCFSKQYFFALWGAVHMLFDIGTRLSKLILYANCQSVTSQAKSIFYHLHKCGELIFNGKGDYDYSVNEAKSFLFASIDLLFGECKTTRDWLADREKVGLFSTESTAKASFLSYCKHYLLCQRLPSDQADEPHAQGLTNAYIPVSKYFASNNLLESIFL